MLSDGASRLFFFFFFRRRPRGERGVAFVAAFSLQSLLALYLFPDAPVLDEAREPLALRTEAARATARFILRALRSNRKIARFFFFPFESEKVSLVTKLLTLRID